MVIVGIILGFISGLLIGLNYRTKKDLDDMLDNFAETEHLRTENEYLKKKLGYNKEEE